MMDDCYLTSKKMYPSWSAYILLILIFVLVRNPARCEDKIGIKLGHKNNSTSALLLRTNITHLNVSTLYEAGYTNLGIIEHLTVMDAPQLVHVAVQDLKLMPNLQTFFITQAPRLRLVDRLPTLPSLRTFMITNCGLTEVPHLSHVHDVIATGGSLPYFLSIELDGNHIRRIPKHALRLRAGQVTLIDNLIEEVPAHVFKNAQIAKLSFKGNVKLRRLDEQAFAGNLLLRQLDLSSTAITELPTSGLDKLEVLVIENTPSLKYIPSIYEFQSLQKAFLTHHFHCCAFAFPEIHDPARHTVYQTKLDVMQKKCEENKKALRRQRSLEPIKDITHRGKLTDNQYRDFPEEEAATTVMDSSESQSEEYGSDMGGDTMDYLEQGFHEDQGSDANGATVLMDCANFSISPRKLECTPQPNALNPCEDVMGWSWLRVCVWIVISAAVIGNLAVLIVLLTNHAELTVPRFLMCNLALSDLCTGLYLFLIAVVDLRSFGEFFNYAYDWQYGVGCKVAGFLSVFSGQISVYTLTIVTLERWFAITYAIYLERRITLPGAAKIMAGGYLFSIVMASLPLAGVSDYSSTSICLPVESINLGDAVYQASLFLTTAVAWVMIVVCYVQIYRSLGGGGEKFGGRAAAAAAEKRIANKMALLIATDLLCWAPVAFFGVTALAGVPLVDVSHGKVLLVFFYPLNACANPFLYAILTKQYRRDLLSLIARSGKCSWLIKRYKLATVPVQTAHTNPSAPALLPLVDYQRNQNHLGNGMVNGDAKL